ncbi:MAG: toxin-antitoxin system HicB family antitoxin [Muribaculaceae bacterium]|nr:toxin-antitoxin system HicB family antitoxin [Muribaculaceae bacterium]
MFKVQKEEMVNKTFRLPLKLVEELHEVAQKQGVSLNNLVKQCCEYALEHLESKSQ